MGWHPIQGGMVVLLVALVMRDKLRLVLRGHSAPLQTSIVICFESSVSRFWFETTQLI